ncbi:MAG: bacteriocin-protection protein, partial [Luteitalea sp.]|nr:bacteriocin-protection protein [Luteitalea sp.]
MGAMKVVFFKSPADLRKWLDKHHATAQELWVGYYKKSSGKCSITWPESVDEALCFGWIDGVRKSVDETSYANRFTRRKLVSTWSAINITRAQELIKEGRMQPAGLQAFQKRQENKARYSYEQQGSTLGEPYERRLRANPRAWKFFRARAPWYQRTTSWWVMSAKKEE